MNRAKKGKESFPTLAFESGTDFNWQIMGLYGPYFGLWNDKKIVKSDPTVLEVSLGWLNKFFKVQFGKWDCLLLRRYISHLRQWIFALANFNLSLFASGSRGF